MRVLGFLGANGSGKDFVRDYMADHFADYKITVSDLVVEEIKAELGIIDADRKTKVNFSKEKTDRFGQNYWMKKTINKIRESGANIVAVAGLRYPEDIITYRNEFDDSFNAVWVEASVETRWKRISERGRADAPKSFSDFLEQDKRERETFRLDEARKLCDYEVDNNGLQEKTYSIIDKLMKKLKVPLKG